MHISGQPCALKEELHRAISEAGGTLGMRFVAEGEEEGADLSTRLELLSLPGQGRGQPWWEVEVTTTRPLWAPLPQDRRSVPASLPASPRSSAPRPQPLLKATEYLKGCVPVMRDRADFLGLVGHDAPHLEKRVWWRV